jgi:hypothetical protein
MNYITLFNKFKTIILFGFFVLFCTLSLGQSSNKAVLTDTITKSSKVKIPPKLRIGVLVGYVYRIARLPENQRLYDAISFKEAETSF